MGFKMSNKFVRLYGELNICLDSFGYDFRFTFYGTIYIITLLNIIGKSCYIVFPEPSGYYGLATEIDQLLYWIFFSWILYIYLKPIRNVIIERFK